MNLQQFGQSLWTSWQNRCIFNEHFPHFIFILRNTGQTVVKIKSSHEEIEMPYHPYSSIEETEHFRLYNKIYVWLKLHWAFSYFDINAQTWVTISKEEYIEANKKYNEYFKQLNYKL